MATKINNKAAREKYLNRLNKVLDFIELNYDKKISLKKLAEISCFSPFHFLRIFSAFLGETPNAFIKRIRVEKSASMLLNNYSLTITKIALKCGYSDSQTFARDFKNFFGISPCQYKIKNGSNICHANSNIQQAKFSSLFYTEIKGRKFTKLNDKIMDIKIQDISALNLANIRHIGKFKNNDNLFNQSFEQLCSWAGPRKLINSETLFLTVYYDDPKITDEDNLRIDICMSIPKNTEQPTGNINKTSILGGKYAVCRIEAKNASDFEQAWDEFYYNWLPQSGYEPDSRPCLEIYRNDPKKDGGVYITDICIPVK